MIASWATINAAESRHKDAWTSDIGSTQCVADNFTLAKPMVIERIDWSGIYTQSNSPTASTDNFTIHIYDDSGNLPVLNPTVSVNIGSPGRTLDRKSFFGFAVTFRNHEDMGRLGQFQLSDYSPLSTSL